MKTRGHRWVVVLAGGEGARMRNWIAQTIGELRPKQYCSFTGKRSMLEHTYDRARSLVSDERIVTVIGQDHWQYLDEPRRIALPGRIIAQPANKDTAPGLLLALTYILSEDPDARVALLPSDHFIAPNDRFTNRMEASFELLERFENRIILLGARPDRPETDYGWIRPSHRLVSGSHPSVRETTTFLEKPDLASAQRFFREGYLWNTMIMTFRASSLWRLAAQTLPEAAERFQRLRRIDGGRLAPWALAEIYEGMPSANLSSDILERTTEKTLVMPLRSVQWCDWGRPERVIESLALLGREIEPIAPSVTILPTPRAIAYA